MTENTKLFEVKRQLVHNIRDLEEERSELSNEIVSHTDPAQGSPIMKLMGIVYGSKRNDPCESDRVIARCHERIVEIDCEISAYKHAMVIVNGLI